MKLVKIPSDLVESNPDAYNSNFHTELEAPQLSIPIEGPSGFHRWLPLITSSRNIPYDHVESVALNVSQALLLISASTSSVLTGTMNRVLAEEIDDEVSSAFKNLVFPPEGYFVRFDVCSPKDGKNGIEPLKSVDEILLRLVTSWRATCAMRHALEAGKTEVNLYFLPFDSRMDTAFEFRVFCAPPSGAITAVSQYSWSRPFVFAKLGEAVVQEFAEKVMQEIQKLHNTIIEFEKDDPMSSLMLKQGFTFDVMWDQTKEVCRLIELNSFGTRSGCGSCLFHWLTDGNVLYGNTGTNGDGKAAEVEFRISM